MGERNPNRKLRTAHGQFVVRPGVHAEGNRPFSRRDQRLRTRPTDQGELAALGHKMQFAAAAAIATRYIRCVREPLRETALAQGARPGFAATLVKNNPRFFFWASLAALAVRVACVVWFPGVVDDSRFYANIADNWLRHGIYGITNSGVVVPTLSRLPGYPAFLAAIFALFGMENFRAVLLVQVLFDLGTCFLIADMAWRLFSSERAARVAFLLAALCPFLANYSAAALTETLEIFFTALALDFALRGLASFSQESHSSRPTSAWIGCGLSIGASILLRPDGGILLAAVTGYLLLLFLRTTVEQKPGTLRPRPIMRAGIVLLVSA